MNKLENNISIQLGESLFIPNEEKSYIVYEVKDEVVKLINYQEKTRLSMTKTTYFEIKDIIQFEDMDFIDFIKENPETFYINTNFEEIDF